MRTIGAACILLLALSVSAEARKHHRLHAASFPQALGAGLAHMIGAPAGNNARPGRWCGWQMRQWFGGGPELNLAANWARVGRASFAHVGAIVVWPHHVGVITGRSGNAWIVKSGNDGHTVRERPRSLAGAIAFRDL